ncbi:YccF domain-containing protein [Vibrio vulnificus]|nr:YccF domain-containing protein [Vibrio vulnificus]MCG6300699.1 YccF domain-containing protein [Vibrio vulnificus]MCR9498970.1 YccF domain-containing protein [Vibrio vulnificus]MCU8388709.1 YccF domain-containing protein [Vibrio vulnificus]MCU8545608.1 YccF domain-containing protein [Vibrio vulnificus]MCU8576237.1 YccF domain-containing protein [Vibrio vulnificus]
MDTQRFISLGLGIHMRTLGNIIWFLFGGVFMGLAWWFFGILAFISIIGIPWGRACFVIGNFSFFPFGSEAVYRDELTNKRDIGTGPLGLIGNVIWFLVAGVWLAIGHILSAVACFITIIGIPFALQHLKLAVISLAPIGQTIVPVEVAEAARYHNRSR